MDGLAETGSSSSSSSLWPCTYDVFLSFSGEDVRKNFVDHLYTALQKRGIHTFKDDEKLERGKSISPSLFKAIEESMISIIIFSQNYASSSWCLDELVKITQCMKLRGQIVLPVFCDVDPSVVRKQKANVGEFFAQHELDFKDDEERVKRWRTAMTEAANVSSWDLPNIANGHESKCIEQIVECVMEILDHTASENLVGIRSRMGTVYSLLNLESDKVQFVGIWGMSGIGKTTITRAIYDKIFRYFQGRIVMHQLIQEMGWHIVRKEASNNLGKYTRLWSPDDILHVLSENTATEAVEGIWLHLPIPKDINVGAEAFKYTDNLRLLKIHYACVSVAPDCLPNKLIWLHWHGYPMKSLPASFRAERHVCLKMQYSHVVHLWKGIKVLHLLKFLNLSHSQKLVSCPDFTGVPNLEKLVLEDCSSIIEIHPSVGYLKKFVLLNLKNCRNLKSLPNNIRLDNLDTLILSGCLKLANFPEITSDMNCLSEVYLEATDVKELPSSIERLTGLQLMNLGYCRNLTNLPKTIGRSKSLRILILSGCSKLEKLSEELGHIEMLEELHCDETAIQSPPSSITLLKNLKTLSFHGCKGMVSQTWSSLFLAWLGQENIIKSQQGIPSDLGCLSSLVELNLSGNNFVDISQASLNVLPQLRILELVSCERLERLPELPTTIEEVFADNCTSLMTDNVGILMLQQISFTNCVGLLENQQMHDMATSLWLYLFKKCIVKSGHFSIYLPGEQVPKWFGYKLYGTSVSMQHSNDWYNDKFMGFAICVVSDLETTWLSVHECYLQEMPGISIEFTIKSHLRRSTSCLMNIGFVGTNKNVASDHTCLAYVPFEDYWSMYKNHIDSPNNWYQMDFSANSLRKHIFLKSWGIRLVYTDDLQIFTS
ncbi:hypothetical protein KY289_020802 [Solanum tuberosum]|nr:hypothetical protein KY289_020802 [Solanum tuberosum]